eukprot:CAMPEP_0173424530 /NCGR_PEP_ID=MMETSP1357-20121228/4429_1 /TAXON_ID=77926 /ORGANISM="Hemiselmis rufescens, Strain PCC563" /LENGTH=54 /DNA_ID=CAMNT_0014387771 /DNA_START=188 /DNA_END=348 /DNA_ORIENTATION=-
MKPPYRKHPTGADCPPKNVPPNFSPHLPQNSQLREGGIGGTLSVVDILEMKLAL